VADEACMGACMGCAWRRRLCRTCTMPVWSLRSMNCTPPMSRLRSTQPHRTTVFPSSPSRSVPQVVLRLGQASASGSRELEPSAAASVGAAAGAAEAARGDAEGDWCLGTIALWRAEDEARAGASRSPLQPAAFCNDWSMLMRAIGESRGGCMGHLPFHT
jgi:hypothetical protein